MPSLEKPLDFSVAEKTARFSKGLSSGKKKEPKPKLFGPDILQWGRGLPRERVGAKKFDMSLETQGTKLFGRDIPGFCRDIPEVPEKFEKKSLCSIFVPYITLPIVLRTQNSLMKGNFVLQNKSTQGGLVAERPGVLGKDEIGP